MPLLFYANKKCRWLSSPTAAEEQSSQPSASTDKASMSNDEFCILSSTSEVQMMDVQPSTSCATPPHSIFSVELCHMSSLETNGKFQTPDGRHMWRAEPKKNFAVMCLHATTVLPITTIDHIYTESGH